MPNLFTAPKRLPLVAPSILSADFARMGDDCRGVLEGGADLLHLDVMDGHFVPNLTMGPDMCLGLRRALPNAFLDVHLMVTDPGRFVEPFVKAGANHLTFHLEVLDDVGLRNLAARVRSLGATAGLAINPPTPVDRARGLTDAFDLFLVMSVNPGYSGQKFIPEVLAKVRALKPRLASSQRLEMDGGIGLETSARVREAGCDVMVGGSAVFGVAAEARPSVIRRLRGDV